MDHRTRMCIRHRLAYLLEDAKSATAAALKEGIVAGGGVALIRAGKSLKKLELEHEMLIVPDATHSAKMIYDAKGLELMQFHQKHFER